MPTDTQGPEYITEKRNNIAEIDTSLNTRFAALGFVNILIDTIVHCHFKSKRIKITFLSMKYINNVKIVNRVRDLSEGY